MDGYELHELCNHDGVGMPTKVILAASIWFFAIGVGNGAETARPKMIRLQPLDSTKLDPFYREDWRNKNVSDEKHGVFIEVVERDHARPFLSTSWEVLSAIVSGCLNKSATDEAERWICHASYSPTCDVRVRIRQDADTLRYLIKTSDAPLLARYIGLREVYDVPFSQEERLTLIEASSRDPKAEMRYMAILKTWDFQPRAKVVPVCTRALTDPSLEVAFTACALLIDEFDVRDRKTGKRLDYGGFFSGPPESHYEMQYDVVAHVAEHIHADDPALVTKDDQAAIRARRHPTDEWWKWMYGKGYKDAQDRYLEEKKNGPAMFEVLSLDTLDATATLADLKTHFPGVTLDVDMKEARVFVLANRNQLARIKARIDWLKAKADDKDGSP